MININRRLKTFIILKSILIALLFSSSALSASDTTSIEKQIIHATTQEQNNQLSLLETLVNINSGTVNIAGVHRVGELLRPQLEALGFKVRWVEEPAQMQRAATLVAEHPGHTGKRLLLIGHLDTVFPPSSPFQHFARHGNSATGPGALDDKGGDVVLLYALKALQSIHALDDADITIVLTGDEEDSGKPTSISRKPLFDAAKKSDIALDFESAVTLNTGTIARRGISLWMLTTQGDEAHSSQIFSEKAGFGAIYELARILDTMRTQLSHEQYLTFSPGLAFGGTTVNYDKKNSEGTAFGKGNVIAQAAMAKGDLRFLTLEQKINAEKKITAIVNQHLPKTTATITYQDGIPSMPPTAANLALLQEYSKASEKLGYGSIKPLDPGSRGAGDISHIASIVKSALAGLGPTGTGEHSAKETLDILSLPIQTQRAALLIYWETHPRAIANK